MGRSSRAQHDCETGGVFVQSPAPLRDHESTQDHPQVRHSSRPRTQTPHYMEFLMVKRGERVPYGRHHLKLDEILCRRYYKRYFFFN